VSSSFDRRAQPADDEIKAGDFSSYQIPEGTANQTPKAGEHQSPSKVCWGYVGKSRVVIVRVAVTTGQAGALDDRAGVKVPGSCR